MEEDFDIIDWDYEQAKFDKRVFPEGDHLVWDGCEHTVFAGKKQKVNRVSFQLSNQRLLGEEDRIYRTCDKKNCVKPEHLELRGDSTKQETPTEGDWANLERRLRKNVKIDYDGHWIWQGPKDNGYHSVTFWGKMYYPHVASCILRRREFVPEGLQVRHLCKTEYCIAPEHLTVGTPTENAADKIIHGTVPLGEKHIMSKLTEKEVMEIYESSESVAKLAEDYGVSVSAIKHIKYGSSWSHITKAKKPVRSRKRKRSEFDWNKAEKKLEEIKAKCDLIEDHWLWQGCLSKGGYGRMSFNGCTMYIHRVVYMCIKKEMIDESILIRHKCRFKNCCAPDHIEEGSSTDNNGADKKRDGTLLKGENHPNAKVTLEQVERIRSYEGNLSELARKMNVSYNIVLAVKTGKTWKMSTDTAVNK